MRTYPALLTVVVTLAMAGCGEAPEAPQLPATQPAEPIDHEDSHEVADDMTGAVERLAIVLAQQPDEVQARYAARRPAEILAFFGVEPGMTVVELLPGGGWYSKILLPYLGEDGKLIGVDYPIELFELFGFMNEAQMAAKETWAEDWTRTAEGWREPGDAAVAAFALGDMPEEMAGTADAVLMIRAMHNLARFEPQGGFLTSALQEIHAALKPGGIVGVVQHEARPDMPDDWASGDAGYLQRDFVIASFQGAGFELVDESDLLANPRDVPTVEDNVWRLPPNLRTSADDPALRAEMQEIGESHRMTLKFRKPD